ncbi:MAG TPA: iron-sulfur cluster assembly protein, partial [Actinomycetota bacterium]|nr:iron-sulfur cluster assembly protein [Actinomycetota bacterium]
MGIAPHRSASPDGTDANVDAPRRPTYHGSKHGPHRGNQDNPARSQGGHPLVTEDQVRQALRGVMDPEIGRPIEDLGMLRGIEIEGGLVRVHVLITIEGCPL